MVALPRTIPMLSAVPLDLAKIRRLREAKGLSVQQAAEAVGLTRFGWYQVESGRRADPSVSTLQKIARALDVGLDDLVADVEE